MDEDSGWDHDKDGEEDEKDPGMGETGGESMDDEGEDAPSADDDAEIA